MVMEEDKQLQTIAVMSITVLMFVYLMQYMQQAMIARVVQTENYGSYWFSPAGHIMNVDYTSEGEPSYVGEAYPGTGNDVAGWRIYQYIYELVDGDWTPVSIRYAGGNTNFDKIWDDREEYDYS